MQPLRRWVKEITKEKNWLIFRFNVKIILYPVVISFHYSKNIYGACQSARNRNFTPRLANSVYRVKDQTMCFPSQVDVELSSETRVNCLEGVVEVEYH